METKQEILKKHLGITEAEFQNSGKKNTLDAMEEYAQLYYESKVQNLSLSVCSARKSYHSCDLHHDNPHGCIECGNYEQTEC